MTAMFDTLKFARSLRDGGRFTPEQAERLSDALSEAIAGEIVAKGDLAATEAELGRKIDALRAELVAAETRLDRKIDALRAELVAAETRLDRKMDALRADLEREIDAMRAELAAIEAKLDRRIDGLHAAVEGVEKGLEAKFEAAKADTIKWIVGIVGFQTVAIVGAAVVLARLLAQ